MKHGTAVIVTAIYHPKPGYEDKFVKMWDEMVSATASQMGATNIGLYHNEETEEFFASGQWETEDAAEKFLRSEELATATEQLNEVCLVPTSREIFEVLKRTAA